MSPFPSLVTCILSLFHFSVVYSDYFKLPFYDCSDADTNYKLGYCIGTKSKDQAQLRWNKWEMVQNLYQWVQQNQTGKAIYNQFLQTNQKQFPSFIGEINGISKGSGLNFQQIFIMTCADELGYFAPKTVAYQPSLACSDYQVTTYDSVTNQLDSSYIAHNEDNQGDNINNTFLVLANVTEEVPFFSYGYAGEMLTQSSSWNDWIIFTSNFVHPANPVQGGLCRNFIARQMSIQKSLNDVLKISAMDGQCSGHNYQVGEFVSHMSTDAEVAYDALHAFVNVNQQEQWLFHANMYIHLNISQASSTSSVARENKAAQLGKPKDLDDMLNFLGDESNASYPIYKSGQENDYTLHSMGIDLVNGNIEVYADNPKKRNKLYDCVVDIGGAGKLKSYCH